VPKGVPLLARVRVAVSTSDHDGCARVLVRREGKGDYRLIIPTHDARAIVDALSGEIAAHPELFPLTHTRRVT
jgi:hypothetical protein